MAFRKRPPIAMVGRCGDKETQPVGASPAAWRGERCGWRCRQSGSGVGRDGAMSIRISRSLAYERTDGERRVIGQDEIESFYGTVVILGGPGFGKERALSGAG